MAIGDETVRILLIGLLLLLLLLNLLLSMQRARVRSLGQGLEARLAAVERHSPDGFHGPSRSPGGRGFDPRPPVFVSCDRLAVDRATPRPEPPVRGEI